MNISVFVQNRHRVTLVVTALQVLLGLGLLYY